MGASHLVRRSHARTHDLNITAPFICAQVIGREVFHSAVGLSWRVPLLVLALALGVAGLAGLGPVRLALAVEPAPVLKGD